MRLLIEKNDRYNKKFITWLINILQMEIMSNLNMKKLQHLDNYIDEWLKNHEEVKLDNINLNTAMIVGVRNLTFYQTGQYFCIWINPKVFYPGTKLRVYKFCEFINYGNLDINGCNIFTNVFSNVAQNLSTYYNIFSLERGV